MQIPLHRLIFKKLNNILIVFSWERIYNTQTYYFTIFLHSVNIKLEGFD